MSNPDDDALVHEDINTMSPTMYNRVHLDLDQDRPKGTGLRIRNSFDYTVKDVRQRISDSTGSVNNRWRGCRSSIQAFPNKAKSYISTTVSFYRENPTILRKEILSGVTVSILQVPESIAFSYVAGLQSMYGLFATVWLGTMTALFGGKPGMISGAAGALAVVIADLTDVRGPLKNLSSELKVEHLLMTVIFVGVIQIAFGLMGLARFVTLIPTSTLIGFLNGLAIIIFMSQLSAFKKCTVPDLSFTECTTEEKLEWMTLDDGTTWMVLAIVLLTMIVMFLWPKTPKIGKVIPASLVAIIIGTAFEFGINRPLLEWDVRTVKDTAPIGGKLPGPHIPDLGPTPDWSTILTYAASLSAIGLFESILTLQAVNEITKTPVTIHACNKECIAQGLGNLFSGLFQSMGGDAMIGQSTINVMNGARYRLSGVVAGLSMLVIIVAASPAIDLVPIACLTGVLFTVVIHTFYWPTFRLIVRLHLVDVIAIVMVTTLAAVVNLAVAVVAGVVWEALVSVWRNAQLITCARSYHLLEGAEESPRSGKEQSLTSGKGDFPENETSPTTTTLMALGPALKEEPTKLTMSSSIVKVYSISGPLTFASARVFCEYFTLDNDPETVVVDFRRSLVCDFSAVGVIRELALRYRDTERRFLVHNICPRSKGLFRRDRDWVFHEHTTRIDPALRHSAIQELDLLQIPDEPTHVGSKTRPEQVLQDLIQDGELQVMEDRKNV